MRSTGHICGIVENGIACDKPAVEFADLETDHGTLRMWFCADHSDQRERYDGWTIKAGLPSD